MFLFNKAREAAYPIIQLIERNPEISLDEENADDIHEISDSIQFNNVVFKYPKATNNVLKGVTINIKKGQTVAIIGKSGSGKSTIAKLLERFYDPVEGEILVDGQNLKSINLRKYRNLIGYVGQEPCLFNETIRENFQNSYPDATEADIVNALHRAHAFDFVEKLEKGIDSNVGAIGGKLSGGQKQRIAIARALVRNPQILIFDEATSALDNESEKKVQEAIESIEGDSITKVVIAHRLTTVKNSETIIVLDDGEIVEQGNHDELMRINGIYAEMTQVQEEANRTKEVLLLEEAKKASESSHRNHDYVHEDTGSEDEGLLRAQRNLQRQDAQRDESEDSEGTLEYLKQVYAYASPK